MTVPNLARPLGSSPHARDAVRTLRQPRIRRSEVVLAHAVLSYLRMAAATTEWAWTDARGRLVDGTEIDPRLTALARRGQPLILTYFIADALGVATLALMHRSFLGLMQSVRCLVDDTLAGRVSGAIIERLGGHYVLLPCPGDPDRVRGVYQVISEGGSCCFPVDGGGPYRDVGTGVIGLAAALKAVIVPLAVRVTPALTFAPQSRVRVPSPRCRLVAAMGDELQIARGGNRAAAAAKLKDALERLGTAVQTAS